MVAQIPPPVSKGMFVARLRSPEVCSAPGNTYKRALSSSSPRVKYIHTLRAKEALLDLEEMNMSLIRWDPFAEFDTMFGRFPRWSSWPRLSPDVEGGTKFEWSPSTDISETEKEYLIRAELPSVKKEDVKVTVERGTITLAGERKLQKEDKNEKFHRVESFSGTFTRSFSLPDDADADAIRCDNKDGVLTVLIPKKAGETTGARQIRVE
jgi:HSP20 family protein